MPLYVISYDIAEDRRRTRVAHRMEDHGVRVQYSVFECELSDVAVRKLLHTLGDMIDQAVDSIRVYPLCARCRSGVTVIGKGRVSGEPDGVQVL